MSTLATLTAGKLDPSVLPPVPAADVTGLATVATTGAYGDLTGQPTIPSTAADVGAVANAAGQTLTLWTGTAAEYSAITSPDANTVYVVSG